jgi:hypothetical protein
MAQVFTADTATEDFAADPAPARTDIDLAQCSFGTDTFRNPCFWILVGVAGALAVQYIFTKRSKE